MSKRSPDPGPFHARRNHFRPYDIMIESDCFEHDVNFLVTGDFETPDHKLKYCQQMAEWMNANIKKDKIKDLQKQKKEL